MSYHLFSDRAMFFQTSLPEYTLFPLLRMLYIFTRQKHYSLYKLQPWHYFLFKPSLTLMGRPGHAFSCASTVSEHIGCTSHHTGLLFSSLYVSFPKPLSPPRFSVLGEQWLCFIYPCIPSTQHNARLLVGVQTYVLLQWVKLISMAQFAPGPGFLPAWRMAIDIWIMARSAQAEIRILGDHSHLTY